VALYRSQSTTYLLQTIIMTACWLLLVGGLNVTIDPYLRFGMPRIEGWSLVKPKAIRQVRMAKAYGVTRGDYQTLFLGNSRVDIGLNPHSDQLPGHFKPAYNLGQPGAGSEMALRYLQHALTTDSPKMVILAVDFLNYLKQPAYLEQLKNRSEDDITAVASSAVFARLSSTTQDQVPWQRARQQVIDVMTSTLSLSALQDSIATIMAQGDPNSADLSEEGYSSGAAFQTLIRMEGQAALFRQKNIEYAKKCVIRMAPPPKQSDEMRAIQLLLELCESRDIRVEVYIHPYHADILEIFEATGHWGEFEQWKTRLTALCESHGARLWDFSGYNQYTTEVPPGGSDRKTVMQWYWESGHYRATLGDRILSQIFEDTLIESEFGRQMTPANLPAWLARSRTAGDDYRKLFSKQSTRVRNLIPQGAITQANDSH